MLKQNGHKKRGGCGVESGKNSEQHQQATDYRNRKGGQGHLAPPQRPKSKLAPSGSLYVPARREEVDQPVSGHNQQKKRKSLATIFNPTKEVATTVKDKEKKKKQMRTKIAHVVVIGPKKVGKTTLLKTLVNQNILRPSTSSPEKDDDKYVPTLEDTFHVQVSGGSRSEQREIILFHDTAGISDFGNVEFRKPYLQVADGFILVYSVEDMPSFNRVDALKKYLDKEKVGGGKDHRKEVPIIVVGTKADLPRRNVDSELALQWANREKVKLLEMSAYNRDSIVEVVHHLTGRFFHSLKEPKFSLSRKLKPEKSNAQIVMDF